MWNRRHRSQQFWSYPYNALTIWRPECNILTHLTLLHNQGFIHVLCYQSVLLWYCPQQPCKPFLIRIIFILCFCWIRYPLGNFFRRVIFNLQPHFCWSIFHREHYFLGVYVFNMKYIKINVSTNYIEWT